MAFSVNTNLGALQAYNALAKVNADTQAAQVRLATNKRINSAADDTSGWNIGKQLEAANLTMKSQLANISSAKNFLDTAQSALAQIFDKLNEIAAKQNDSADPLKDASALQGDVKTLADEISSILSNTTINGTDLLASASNSFSAGGSADVDVNIGAEIGDNSTALEALQEGDEDSLTTDIADFQDNIRAAITYIGNTYQTLDSREQFITSALANNEAAVSRLFDADMASEQLSNTKGQVAGQIATAMFSQMNAAPQQVLALFR